MRRLRKFMMRLWENETKEKMKGKLNIVIIRYFNSVVGEGSELETVGPHELGKLNARTSASNGN